jgi:hypothetical protein
MFKPAFKFLAIAALVLAGGFALYKYDQSRTEVRLQEEIKKLQAQKQELQDYIVKLTSSRRVAEIVVTDQAIVDGILNTTLLFSEIGPDGRRLPPRFFTIKGYIVHIEALTIRFDLDFIRKNDPFRGQSIALFHRLYGEYQSPNDGFPLDTPNTPPGYYNYTPDYPLPEKVKQYQNALWSNFWRLADDEAFRKEKGVRLVQGEGPWRPVYPDYIYTISLETAGGLTISSRPIDDLYRQFLKAVKNTH